MDKSLIKLCKSALTIGLKKGTVNQRFGVLKRVSVKLDGVKLVTESVIKWDDNHACSAGLGYGRADWEGVDAIASVSQVNYIANDSYRDGTLTKDEAMKFYDILLNHTPFGACIATTNTEEAYDLGLVIDTHHPSRIVVGTTMAQRLAWEHTKISKAILTFADMGMHKGLAFLLGHLYSKTGASVNNEWHTCIDSHKISPTYIRNFILGIYKSDGNYNVNKRYDRTVNGTWSDGDLEIAEGLRNDVAKYAKNAEQGELVMNPFAKSLIVKVQKQNAKAIVGYFGKELGNILKG